MLQLITEATLKFVAEMKTLLVGEYQVDNIYFPNEAPLPYIITNVRYFDGTIKVDIVTVEYKGDKRKEVTATTDLNTITSYLKNGTIKKV